MDWFQILVIVLAVFLAIFLIASIVLTVIIIRLTRDIKVIAENARIAVTTAAKTATNISNITTPVYMGRFITKFIKKLRK